MGSIYTTTVVYMRPFGQNGYILVAFSAPPPSPRIEASNVFRAGLAQPQLFLSPL